MTKIIISLFCIGSAVASFFFFSYPNYTEAQNLSSKATTLENSLKTADELLGLRDQLLSQYRTLPVADVEKLTTALPNHARNINYIIDMEALLAKHNLVLVSAKIEPPAKEDSAKGRVTADSSSLEAAAKGYKSLDISMSVRGTLSDFTQFMADLEQNLRLTSISSVSFKASKAKTEGEASDTNTDSIKVNENFLFDLGLAIYWLKK
jgi:Tfp pilus assembly protein PilO